MVTRAISLLIIVGDHEALSTNEYWQKLIENCILKGAIKRGDKKLHPRISAPQ